MKRFSLLLLAGTLCSGLAFAGTAKFTTGKGGDPTDISSNDGTFTLTPDLFGGGGIYLYRNIGPNAITELTVDLTAPTPAEPYSFSSAPGSKAQNQLSELIVTGVKPPFSGTEFLSWDFSSYIFDSIALTGTAAGVNCSGGADSTGACLTITFSGGSIGLDQTFGFDLNDDFANEIVTDPKNPNFGQFNGNDSNSGGFTGTAIMGDASNPAAAVPEPATLGTLALAGIVLAGFGARRARS